MFFPETQGQLFSVHNESIGLINAFFTALAYLSIKGLSKYYETRYIVLSFMLFGIVLPLGSFILAEIFQNVKIPLIVEAFIWPNRVQIFYLLALGIISMVGQIFLTRAFSNGKGGVISTAGYSNIAFSMIFGWVLGDAFPNAYSMAGIAAVICSGILIAFTNAK